MRAVGALSPDYEPRATEHIPSMIEMIGVLIEKGHAYAAEGHVLFSVPSMADYGELSGRNREQQIDGARVEVAPYKRDAADFVLWKPSGSEAPGWESPWGYGRPGWHIECSAMSHMYLGETFDIHAGGIDLVFPHHENEIAQTRCCFGTSSMANVWMHNGYVSVNGEKMSKSLGNFYTVNDLLSEWPGEVIRYALLAGHYRAPLDYSKKGLSDARTALDRLYQSLRSTEQSRWENISPSTQIVDALADDLNTPLALSKLHEIARNLNKVRSAREISKLKSELVSSARFLGFLQQEPDKWFKESVSINSNWSNERIEKSIADREEARLNKDFKEADRIRNELQSNGITLEDGPDGTKWRHN
jgi:cysteinyl-tRNA synthetase